MPGGTSREAAPSREVDGSASDRTPLSPAPEAGVAARMRAAVRDRYGPVSAVAVQEVPAPAPAAGEVLIEVCSAGLDRGVWHVVTGLPYLMRLTGFGLRRPRQPVLGSDVAGRVVASGPDVDRPRVGDAVVGIGSGTFARYTVARADRLVPKPTRLSFGQAAAAPTSGLAAMQAVHEVGRVEAGQHVLVLGASGGVGSLAVQLAALAGARVTGVAGRAKLDLVRSLGADRVIDYAQDDPCDGSIRYDLILDIGGRRRLGTLRTALTRDGTLVIVGGEDGGRWTGGVGRQLRAVLRSMVSRQRLTAFVSSPTPQRLERLRLALEQGLTPVVTETYSLEEVPRALRDLEAGRIRGKSVIEVRSTREQDPD